MNFLGHTAADDQRVYDTREDSLRDETPIAPSETSLAPEADEIAAIINVLDVALDCHTRIVAAMAACQQGQFHYPGTPDVSVSFMASAVPLAERALRMWAGAHGFPVREMVNRYPDTNTQIRSINVDADGCRGRLAWVQWNSEPLVAEPEPFPDAPEAPVTP